jgi:hypothetical protein
VQECIDERASSTPALMLAGLLAAVAAPLIFLIELVEW